MSLWLQDDVISDTVSEDSFVTDVSITWDEDPDIELSSDAYDSDNL